MDLKKLEQLVKKGNPKRKKKLYEGGLLPFLSSVLPFLIG